MSGGLERISLDKRSGHPLVTIREHLIRYIWAIQGVLDKDVLDLGCGTGYGVYLMSYWAKSVSGYDNSELAIGEAKRDFQMKCLAFLEVRDLEIVTTLGNMLAQKFDVITCFETFEHLKNSERLLGIIRSHLKPKGVFYFSTPNKPSLKDGSEWHKSVFNKDKWIKLLRKHFGSISHRELWGQDQYGITKNLKKPYILGRITI